jgi:hypothetical protein
MKVNLINRCVGMAAAAGLFTLASTVARAQVVAPSTYTTTIQVQGEAPGTEFADWAGIPIVDMDPVDNAGGTPPFIDIGNIQIANDDQFIYIHATLHAGTSLGNLFLAFDLDQTTTTGFDPFGVQVIGSELGYQTDFAFSQATGVYNNSNMAPVTGGPIGGGHALIYPFWTEAGAPSGSEIEWKVPLDAMISGVPAFTDGMFDLALWADSSLGDISQRISYTLAEPPAGLPGDFNRDNKVDAADYVVWRKTNDPIDGYNVWVENFGRMGAGAGSAAVPEPTSACLLIAAALVLVRVHSRA